MVRLGESVIQCRSDTLLEMGTVQFTTVLFRVLSDFLTYHTTVIDCNFQNKQPISMKNSGLQNPLEAGRCKWLQMLCDHRFIQEAFSAASIGPWLGYEYQVSNIFPYWSDYHMKKMKG